MGVVPRLVTHFHRLNDSEDIINDFWKSAKLLKNKLGLVLLQLPPSISFDLEKLRKALLCFPDPKKVVVEFRHPSWINNETKNLLTELGCIFCIADSPQFKLRDWLTSDAAYIRLHGIKTWYDYKYTHVQLRQVARLVGRLKKQGAKKVYIMFNNDYFSYAIDNALYLETLV